MKITISSLFEMRLIQGQVSHLISVVDPDDVGRIPTLGVPPERRLVIACDDVDSRAEALGRERAMPGSRCIAPTLTMVRRALDFASRLGESDHLVVHCGHGISRSPALALAILAQAEPNVSERDLFERVLLLRPGAAPNPLIVKHADNLLNRGGKFSLAIKAR